MKNMKNYWYNDMKYHEKYEELLVQLHEISWNIWRITGTITWNIMKNMKNYWYNYMKYHEKYEE